MNPGFRQRMADNSRLEAFPQAARCLQAHSLQRRAVLGPDMADGAADELRRRLDEAPPAAAPPSPV